MQWRKEYLQMYEFRNKFKKIGSELSDGRFFCRWEDRRPCFGDVTTTTPFDSHYIYHTAWAARLLAHHRPEKHIDIGSSLYFASLVSAFLPVEFYDFRPPKLSLSNLSCGYADLLHLPFENASLRSLSCMHVVEHIGLERYGDPFDPKGDIKAISEMSRVLTQGGHLYFVVPVGGVARIQYNAHRIYTPEQIVGYFDDLGVRIDDFALVTDEGSFIDQAILQDASKQRYGCGCFHFIKR